MLHGTGEATPFENRREAGRVLARRLAPYHGGDTIVLALPRGGVPVAYEVARALGAPLDVIVARKLGAPGQPEFGIGAIAPGVRLLDENGQAVLRHTPRYIEQVTAEETAEMERRLRLYRGDRPDPDVQGRTVILVDDGLATGVTARAAIRSLRQQGAGRIILAVPVCPADTAESLSREADEVACAMTPRPFHAVGSWYLDFGQTTDQEVAHLLDRSRAEPAASASGSSSVANGGGR